MSPALLRGDVHLVLVLAGHEGAGRCQHWYVAEMGLTNADVFTYRRNRSEEPLAGPLQLPCGVTVHERLMLPNNGFDASAFYSYVVEHYNNLPRLAVFFIHDHGKVQHMTCEALFSRSRLWYRHATVGGPMSRRMTTFTWEEFAPDKVNNNWTGTVNYTIIDEDGDGEPHPAKKIKTWWHRRRRQQRRLLASQLEDAERAIWWDPEDD